MLFAICPINVLCRLLPAHYFPLDSFPGITVIWSPLFDVASNGGNSDVFVLFECR
jgi:hypothetical protein